jgi:HSF-type DNA-binding
MSFLYLLLQLMKLMNYADEQCKEDKDFCVTWLEDGKSFVIRNPDAFTRQVVPKFFKQTKFSSFTRKLYRWGFRQINRGIGPDDPIIFGNEYFVRDDEELMVKMRSVTAAGTRKQEQTRVVPYGKRHFESGMFDQSFQEPKRFMFDQYMHQKSMMHQNPSLYGGMSAQGNMPLASALRTPMGGAMGDFQQQQYPQMQFQMQQQQGGFPMNNASKGYDMMQGVGMQGVANQGGMMMNHQQQFMHHQQNLQQQNQQQLQQQHHHQAGPQGNGNNAAGGFHNNQSTAEIVNAAIAALRYAN